MLDADVATMHTKANRVLLRKALQRCGMACDNLEAVVVPDSMLSKREVEQLVGVAAAEQLAAEGDEVAPMGEQEPPGAPAAAEAEGPKAVEGAAAAGPAGCQQQPWPVKAVHLMAAAEAVRRLQAEAAAQTDRATALSQVASDQYEKQLLNEVIAPEEINVAFDDIGALEQVGRGACLPACACC